MASSLGFQNTVTKLDLGRKAFIFLILTHHSSSLKETKARTQGKNLEAGPKAEVTEEHHFLAFLCSLLNLLCFVFETGFLCVTILTVVLKLVL